MYLYRLISVLILGLYLFSPLILEHWASTDGPWYSPFIPWAALIGVAALLEQLRGPDEL